MFYSWLVASFLTLKSIFSKICFSWSSVIIYCNLRSLISFSLPARTFRPQVQFCHSLTFYCQKYLFFFPLLFFLVLLSWKTWFFTKILGSSLTREWLFLSDMSVCKPTAKFVLSLEICGAPVPCESRSWILLMGFYAKTVCLFFWGDLLDLSSYPSTSSD